MGSFKAQLPRANPPVCWWCDRQLYGGGRFYELVAIDGVERPVHQRCAPKARGEEAEGEE